MQTVNEITADDTNNIEQKKEIIALSINQKELLELEKLDGCYVIKTDLLDLDKNTAHDRYKQRKVKSSLVRSSFAYYTFLLFAAHLIILRYRNYFIHRSLAGFKIKQN